eukprot:TRINITY_DN60973_c0_g1_i1.p1 TRINITY_DN60973_c0_g1~~TRINITY_DN60973_c0_g1_i1.p1  ORF type:complete len:1007 (-),score=101.74 TRINITY_DN60973_c0_g1_i1:101-2863(-)
MAKIKASAAQFEAATADLMDAEETGEKEEEDDDHLNHRKQFNSLWKLEKCVMCHEFTSPNGDSCLSFMCEVVTDTVVQHTATCAAKQSADVAPPPQASGQDGSLLCSSLGEKATITSTTPCFFHLDQKPNIRVHACGHLMHLECFDNYATYLRNNIQSVLEHRAAAYLNPGEITCPLCGRICNIVVPILPQQDVTSLLQDTATLPSTDDLSNSSNDCQLWTEIRQSCSAFNSHAKPPLPSDDKQRRIIDALDTFGTTMFTILNNAGLEELFERNCYRNSEDYVWNMCTSVASNLSHIEVACRRSSLENGTLSIPLRYATVLRRMLHTATQFLSTTDLNGNDVTAVWNCLNAEPCNLTPKEQRNVATSKELQFPPLLSSDIFHVGLAGLITILLTSKQVGFSHYMCYVRRLYRSYVVQCLVSLLSPNPAAVDFDGSTSNLAKLCQQVQQFLLSQVFINGPPVANSTLIQEPSTTSFPGTPTDALPTMVSFTDDLTTQASSSSSSSSSAPGLDNLLAMFDVPSQADNENQTKKSKKRGQPVKYPASAKKRRACIAGVDDIRIALEATLVPFVRKLSLLHYLITGEPLPHVPGKVDAAETPKGNLAQFAAIAMGPPQMLTDTESDADTLKLLLNYMHLLPQGNTADNANTKNEPTSPTSDCVDTVETVCELLLDENQSGGLVNKLLQQLLSATTVNLAAETEEKQAVPVTPNKADTEPTAMEVDKHAETTAEDNKDKENESGETAVVPHQKGGVVPLIPEIASPARPFQLVQLPTIYSPLIEWAHTQKCGVCDNVPKFASLCLYCGTLVCCNQACCSTEVISQGQTIKMRECAAHAMSCGNGTAAFMIIRTTQILVVHQQRVAMLQPVYLDCHGEEDKELRRGRPMHVSRCRLQQLMELVSNCRFGQDANVLSAASNHGWHAY